MPIKIVVINVQVVPLALVLPAALLVNILTFHATMNPSAIGLHIVVAVSSYFCPGAIARIRSVSGAENGARNYLNGN